MRLLINANVFGWKMTGLMPKGAGWFFGFSRRPKEIDMEKLADGAMSALTAGLCVGDRVKLLKSIYDDGEDHHPPGCIAHHGEVLLVKAVRGDVLAVAHEGNPGAFVVYTGEYETYNA